MMKDKMPGPGRELNKNRHRRAQGKKKVSKGEVQEEVGVEKGSHPEVRESGDPPPVVSSGGPGGRTTGGETRFPHA